MMPASRVRAYVGAADAVGRSKSNPSVFVSAILPLWQKQVAQSV